METKNKKKVLIIVAHPDDEVIWMGGTLLSNKDWDVTILSLCRKDDKDRAPRFRKACQILKAKGYMSDLEDEKLEDLPEHEIEKRILKLAGKNYDYVFTHGKNGEYGHKRHKEVYHAVNSMIKKGLLKCRKIFFFSYKKKGKYCYPDKNSDTFINLKNSSYSRKKDLIKEIYGFDKGGFEEVCCRKIETFKTKEII